MRPRRGYCTRCGAFMRKGDGRAVGGDTRHRPDVYCPGCWEEVFEALDLENDGDELREEYDLSE